MSRSRCCPPTSRTIANGARFQREAEVLASLNPPHIAQVYGFENPPEGGHHLVMEFVDGEDLSVRIRRGPIPLDEALPIAQQIAAALEAAFTTLATAPDADFPFWSPDGNEVAFFAGKKLFRINI